MGRRKRTQTSLAEEPTTTARPRRRERGLRAQTKMEGERMLVHLQRPWLLAALRYCQAMDWVIEVVVVWITCCPLALGEAVVDPVENEKEEVVGRDGLGSCLSLSSDGVLRSRLKLFVGGGVDGSVFGNRTREVDGRSECGEGVEVGGRKGNC